MYAPRCRGDNPSERGDPLPAGWPAPWAGHHEPVTDKVPRLTGLHVRGRVKVVQSLAYHEDRGALDIEPGSRLPLITS
jgi:hypothetical protein